MDIMKVFTIVNDEIYPGAKVTSHLSKADKKIPIISVGEKQWCDGFQFIPICLSSEQKKEWEKKSETLTHYIRLSRFMQVNSLNYYAHPTQHCLVVFKSNINQGGRISYRGDIKDDLKTNLLFPGRILKRGRVGHVFLGQTYTGLQIIATVPRGKVFSLCKNGQMIQKEEYYFLFDGHDIRVYNKEEWLSLVLFPQGRF